MSACGLFNVQEYSINSLGLISSKKKKSLGLIVQPIVTRVLHIVSCSAEKQQDRITFY
jgi:hypothetical protein